MHAVISAIVDDGHFLEMQSLFAPNVVIGYARVEGHTIGIVANQPMQFAGTLDINASEKAARFVRNCDAFNIPILTLVDVPGSCRARTRSSTASSAAARSCCTPTPRRRCRRSR
jgi:propionyl-CoA carboxylase beta chain